MSIIETDIMYGPDGPTEKQKEFRDLDAYVKLFGGGVGSGKTWTLCAESVRMCLAFPGNRFFMCRQDGVVFKNTTLVTLLQLIDQIEYNLSKKILFRHNQTKQIIYLRGGSVILYGGLSKSEGRNPVKSLELGGFAIDEASEITERNFWMLKSRNRWVLPSGLRPSYCGFLASNPENCWLIPTFVEKETRPTGFGYVMSLTSDNPRLDENYEKDLRKTNPKNWVEQYLDGNWRFSEGRIWPEFDPNIHVLPNKHVATKPRPSLSGRFVLGIDHGQRHPTVALAMFRDKDDNIFVYDEYYDVGVISQHCREIKRRFPLSRFQQIVLDPKAWDKNQEKNGLHWSVAEEYFEHKIPVTKATNNVDLGLAKVASHMYVDPDHRHPLTGKLGAPRLYVDKERCPKLIEQVQGYVCKKDKQGQYLEKPRKTNDDACDALRYGIMAYDKVVERKQDFSVHPRLAKLRQREEVATW